ncbi:hypothetical protein F4775DRAFT_596678 [Biscogniauxia sp. FL1348]|nr:hypothetical protein F4775DRAFT_596678 [Biscogniauxia sp. FL1348]
MSSQKAEDGSMPLPALGFISIDVTIHRPSGDPFNEKTWPFPIIREKADNSSETQVVSKSYDDAFIDRFVDAGKRLAQRGAVGIITSCGFLAMAQPELAARLPIPIATSALVQIPSILTLLSATRTVGILTYDDARLGTAQLDKLGIPSGRCHIRGVPASGGLRQHIQHGAEYVHEDISRQLVEIARDMVAEHPDIAAICLECTNMPPFSEAIQDAVGLPVYDAHTMGCWFYSGLVSRRPKRWGAIERDTLDTRT